MSIAAIRVADRTRLAQGGAPNVMRCRCWGWTEGRVQVLFNNYSEHVHRLALEHTPGRGNMSLKSTIWGMQDHFVTSRRLAIYSLYSLNNS
ncbi:MAG: hypothetical protein ACRECP_03830 [Methylocella sp.]